MPCVSALCYGDALVPAALPHGLAPQDLPQQLCLMARHKGKASGGQGEPGKLPRELPGSIRVVLKGTSSCGSVSSGPAMTWAQFHPGCRTQTPLQFQPGYSRASHQHFLMQPPASAGSVIHLLPSTLPTASAITQEQGGERGAFPTNGCAEFPGTRNPDVGFLQLQLNCAHGCVLFAASLPLIGAVSTELTFYRRDEARVLEHPKAHRAMASWNGLG